MVKFFRACSCLLLPALILSGCSRTDVGVTKKTFLAMDTVMTLTVYGENGEAAAEQAASRILEIEKALSASAESSELAALNASAGEPVAVSRDVLNPLRSALGTAKKSGGALDITVLPLVEAWGFLTKDYHVPERAELDALLEKIGYEKIKIDGETVVCPEGMGIDFGAVAKGYASQCAAEILRGRVTGAVISLGGSVQTVGVKPNGQKWKVAIADPLDPENGTVGTLSVEEAAVVTSGSYQRYFERGGVRYHHILDPKTGAPAESGLLSVTVVCADGTEADGLSTALFVLGLDGAMNYRDTYGGFEAVFVTEDRRVTVTDGLKGAFEAAEGGAYTYE